MAYHGYIHFLKNFLKSKKEPPSVLEIGVDRGVTCIPVITCLSKIHPQSLYLGVDILLQDSLKLTINYLDESVKKVAWLLEGNSLEILPSILNQGLKFDVILIDGDHNYHTVSQEMTFVDRLLKNQGIVIVDDYDGKWSERDLFYSERPGYESINNLTKRLKTEKEGVKPAVDDWLVNNQNWEKIKLLEGEPILLKRKFDEK